MKVMYHPGFGIDTGSGALESPDRLRWPLTAGEAAPSSLTAPTASRSATNGLGASFARRFGGCLCGINSGNVARYGGCVVSGRSCENERAARVRRAAAAVATAPRAVTDGGVATAHPRRHVSAGAMGTTPPPAAAKQHKSRRKISLPWFRQSSVSAPHAMLSRQHTIDTPSSFHARLLKGNRHRQVIHRSRRRAGRWESDALAPHPPRRPLPSTATDATQATPALALICTS